MIARIATAVLLGAALAAPSRPAAAGEPVRAKAAPERVPGTGGNVCPPFFLRDEAGNVINPVSGENVDRPYSPKQTCGACHDYDKITQGYHFQQGADEKAPGPPLGERCQWVSSPGNYGGAWCSPAPLYSYLSPKHNDDPREMDMTSFDFITRGCGNCHPGGGPMEYDREGKRYDVWMADPASGFTPGGENNLDGDYYKARWSESGVLEADCLLCHLPAYDFGERNKQLGQLNFRWAATAAAGLAQVTGAVARNEAVTVTYDASKFDADGKLSPHIVVSPRNETCLQCHAQPGWKKRGANFRARTDVHLRAGMRCVDCHPAGSRADDPRINGREVHQIAKGDDPGGQVRNDLDNTVRDCDSCHTTGEFGAPIAVHAGLPPLHLERIACQACHIPERLVMPIEVQAGDVFNPDAKIPKGGKQLWTFYGVGGTYRNHYGFLEMMGYDDKPTESFRPALALYKGKIYPVNRVHSSWPGIEIEGKPGLMQPRMSDIRKMWVAHREDPEQHPEVAEITDDNGDGVIEVNRPAEIDALITAVTNHLTAIGYPLEGRRVVWVNNDRVYRSGTEYRTVEQREWEASPYANIHKYSHDVFPAKAALGANGCTNCHSPGTEFFYAPALKYLFDENAKPVVEPQYRRLGLSGAGVALGVWRESVLKRAGLWVPTAVVLLCLFHLVIFGARRVSVGPADKEVARYRLGERLAHAFGLVSFLVLVLTGCSFLLGNGDPLGDTARMVHTYVGWVFAAAVVAILFFWFRSGKFAAHDWRWLRYLGGYFGFGRSLPAGRFNAGQKMYFWFVVLCGLGLFASGVLMSFRDGLRPWMPFAYTIHDGLAILFVSAVVAHFYLAVVAAPGALRAIFEGKVSARWAQHHHPDWPVEAPYPLHAQGPTNEEQ